jgi:SAM-dependent methyltransferase
MFGLCNLCGFLIVRLNSTGRGTRCLRCRSTQVHRAVGLAIHELPLPAEPRVYELSSRGALFRHLKLRYPNMYFSEYYDDVPPGQKKGNVVCQDLHELLLADESFDLVTSTEVFEHVPDDRQGFREVCRVLAPGGHFVFTVPLGDFSETIERCRVAPDGSIVHSLPPEYHGDRIRGKNSVLAFRNYGLDILDRLRACGFEARVARYACRRRRIADQKVVVARKSANLEAT